jgi:DNA-binding IclR family transcriptional regulator
VPGSAAIAAPIVGANGQVITAFVIGTPIERFRRHSRTLEKLIKSVADRASGRQFAP